MHLKFRLALILLCLLFELLDLGIHPVHVGQLIPYLHLLVMGFLLVLLDYAFGAATLADRLHNIGGYALRQAHFRRGSESLEDLWIHSDHHVFLLLDLLIALGHLIPHPRPEVILHHGVDHVANPGLGGPYAILDHQAGTC